ncbi:hypothetical protein GOP47_0009520 [Adiantum capillus-veneris]|uniref:Secreted protein n=1 Tax=Adiantum capillus-veneris TaxID=13818 RepID=A0A9D4ZHA4_ADICA|nr:hypothetical protein GOP47_0009520 [Adiantum capillus-veneris]
MCPWGLGSLQRCLCLLGVSAHSSWLYMEILGGHAVFDDNGAVMVAPSKTSSGDGDNGPRPFGMLWSLTRHGTR